MSGYDGDGDGNDGSCPGLVGPGSAGRSPEAIVICAIAAIVISTNRTMIAIRVGRRTARG